MAKTIKDYTRRIVLVAGLLCAYALISQLIRTIVAEERAAEILQKADEKTKAELEAAVKKQDRIFKEWVTYSDGSEDLEAVIQADPGAVNAQDSRGATRLMYLASKGKVKSMTILLHHGADISIKDKSGCVALDYARRKQQKAAIALLTKLAAKQEKQGRTSD